ncbi:hypothetical protein L9F63_006958 [Diploptera punctata]|uniref:Uncharacterized protein n=1 Tax=Diploptera punctata TaxID=6984 RepID=A0AAD7Z9A9_DIPPU|nr:hypothetical protein L9F63_006958 [Diploptera punctata]
MAAAEKCKKKTEGVGVVTISESLVKRLETGEGDAKEQEARQAATDEEWMKKLKCMDDYHTEEHGLTFANFNKVLSSTEREIALATKEFVPCHDKVRDLIKCYRQFKKCSLMCSREVQEFVNCVDETKKEMETSARNKNKINEITSDTVL